MIGITREYQILGVFCEQKKTVNKTAENNKSLGDRNLRESVILCCYGNIILNNNYFYAYALYVRIDRKGTDNLYM